MKDYSAISDVSNAIVELLREILVPEVVLDRKKILMCSPADRGDANITVYLYNVREEGLGQMIRGIPAGGDKIQNTSVFLKLDYMISVFSAADVTGRNMEEMKILGAIFQIFHDNFYISPETYQFTEGIHNPIRMEQSRLSEDEKYKIFSLPGMIHKPSAFYTVPSVEIKSGKENKLSRVKEFGAYHYSKQEKD